MMTLRRQGTKKNKPKCGPPGARCDVKMKYNYSELIYKSTTGACKQTWARFPCVSTDFMVIKNQTERSSRKLMYE